MIEKKDAKGIFFPWPSIPVDGCAASLIGLAKSSALDAVKAAKSSSIRILILNFFFGIFRLVLTRAGGGRPGQDGVVVSAVALLVVVLLFSPAFEGRRSFFYQEGRRSVMLPSSLLFLEQFGRSAAFFAQWLERVHDNVL
jgi:hypothetical protein